jgi:hypothetical protein
MARPKKNIKKILDFTLSKKQFTLLCIVFIVLIVLKVPILLCLLILLGYNYICFLDNNYLEKDK